MSRSKSRALRALGALVVSLTFGGVLGGCSKSEAAQPPAAEGTPGGQGTCGDKDLPDCPLQGWMKATLKPYVAASDTARLAEALEQLAAAAPAGFDGWRETAEQSAKAARAGDLAGAKVGCKRCHDAHRSRFRKERRAVALF
jgi:hypothetical protein